MILALIFAAMVVLLTAFIFAGQYAYLQPGYCEIGIIGTIILGAIGLNWRMNKRRTGA